MNRRYVFQKEGNVAGSALKYLTLAISIYLLSTGSIAIFYRLFHASPYLLKILVDGSLFFISWYVQKHLIFCKAVSAKKQEMEKKACV